MALLHRGSQGIAQPLAIGVSDVQMRRAGNIRCSRDSSIGGTRLTLLSHIRIRYGTINDLGDAG
jgi:hypothetical protein